MYLQGLLEGPDLLLPEVPRWAEPSWHLFVIRSTKRDELQRELEALGIYTLIHYPAPPHRQQAYQESFSKLEEVDPFPLATSLGRSVLSLPIGPHMTEESVETVICAMNRLTST